MNNIIKKIKRNYRWQLIHNPDDVMLYYPDVKPRARRERIMMYLNIDVIGDATVNAQQVAEDFVDKNKSV